MSGNRPHAAPRRGWGVLKSMRLGCLAGLCLGMLGLASLQAATITNGDFSLCTTGSPCFTPDGWTQTSNDFNGGWRATGGNPGGYFIINSAPAVIPSIQQNIIGLVVGTTYQLSGDYVNQYNDGVGAQDFGVQVDNQAVQTFAVPAGTNAGPWLHFSFDFTYTGSSPELQLTSQRINDVDVAIDNIQITTVTATSAPEPSTLMLLAGGLGIVLMRRKRVLPRSGGGC